MPSSIWTNTQTDIATLILNRPLDRFGEMFFKIYLLLTENEGVTHREKTQKTHIYCIQHCLTMYAMPFNSLYKN